MQDRGGVEGEEGGVVGAGRDNLGGLHGRVGDGGWGIKSLQRMFSMGQVVSLSASTQDIPRNNPANAHYKSHEYPRSLPNR